MGNIFTRKALNDIMGNEGLTPEQRTEQVFGLYGRALDDGYIAKTAAQQAQQTALDNAKAESGGRISKRPIPGRATPTSSCRGSLTATRPCSRRGRPRTTRA